MNSPVVALVTEQQYEAPAGPDWYAQQILDDDALLATALGQRGIATRRIDWRRGGVDWSQFAAVVLRTPWNYSMHFAEFCRWLEHVDDVSRTINEVAVLRWNMDKHYLGDLQDAGVNVVRSRFVEVGEQLDLAAWFDTNPGQEMVFKPTVSGGARHTHRVTKASAVQGQAVFDGLVADRALLVQPFQRDILVRGEITLMMFAGQYTHAVRKVAKEGDYRVQDDHGGRVMQYEPTPEEVAFARLAMQATVTKRAPVYGRVDLVRDNDGRLAIMELELVEPELWLRAHPASANAFAEAVATALRLG